MKNIMKPFDPSAAVADLRGKSLNNRGAASCFPKEIIEQAKRDFIRHAVAVCPQWRVIDEQRDALNAIVRWAVMDTSGTLDPNMGLWLWGNIGTGKTTLLEITKRLCAQYRARNSNGYRYTFLTVNSAEICEAYELRGHDGMKDFIYSDALAIDEVGSEPIPSSHYGTSENVIQYLIQRRYERRTDGFTHVTTNLMPEEIQQWYSPRIYDRCREMFNFVQLPGCTLRRSAGRV